MEDLSGSGSQSAGGGRGSVQETPWVRSIYLYVMCLVGVILTAIGAVTFAVGLTHVVVPDFGQRDTVSRFGVGISRIGEGVIDVLEQQQGDSDFCKDFYENEQDIEDCEAEQSSQYDAIRDGFAELEKELDRQTRNTAADGTLRGALTLVAGLLIFRIHGRRTELFPRGPRAKRSRRSRNRPKASDAMTVEPARSVDEPPPAPIPFPPLGPTNEPPTGPAAI